MSDPRLNKALKWAIANSEGGSADGANSDKSQAERSRGLDPDVMAALMGGPSDADLMRDSMAAVHHPEQTHENRMVAWDNFEQLIENLDNANNIQNLGLWPPLVQKFDAEHHEERQMAFWCVSTAVQNNIKTQEAFFAIPGAMDKVVHRSLKDEDPVARKKAVNALSSMVRNYQPAMDHALAGIPPHLKPDDSLDAADMEAIDKFVGGLREHALKTNGQPVEGKDVEGTA